MAGSSNQMTDFFDQLPTPPREKVARGVWYAGVSVAGLAAFLTVMPYVNHALSLGLDGATLVVKLGAVAALGAVGVYTAMSFWTPFKRKVESMARNTTIAIFGEDPITPLHMWLGEVRQDCEQIEQSAHDIGGIIAENEKTIEDNEEARRQSDKRFSAAVKLHGENSAQARTASVEAGGYNDRANNARRINGPLKELYGMLIEIAEATRLGEREAEMAIGTAEQEWRAALKAEKAMGNAQRSLNKRSERSVNAMVAFDIIRQKYAGSFGQLRSLRHLTNETISKVELSGGVHHEEALERLREQGQKLLGYQPAVSAHDFSPTNGSAVLASSNLEASNLKLFDDDK